MCVCVFYECDRLLERDRVCVHVCVRCVHSRLSSRQMARESPREREGKYVFYKRKTKKLSATVIGEMKPAVEVGHDPVGGSHV